MELVDFLQTQPVDASEEALHREREMRLRLALPPEGVSELFELREAWVARLRLVRSIRNREQRLAEERLACRRFERDKLELFRKYGLVG